MNQSGGVVELENGGVRVANKVTLLRKLLGLVAPPMRSKVEFFWALCRRRRRFLCSSSVGVVCDCVLFSYDHRAMSSGRWAERGVDGWFFFPAGSAGERPTPRRLRTCLLSNRLEGASRGRPSSDAAAAGLLTRF